MLRKSRLSRLDFKTGFQDWIFGLQDWIFGLQDWTFWIFWSSWIDFGVIFRFKIVSKPRFLQEIAFLETCSKHCACRQKSRFFLSGTHWYRWKQWNKSLQEQYLSKCALEEDVLSSLQPFWIVLVRFRCILGHFGVPLGVKNEHQNQKVPNKAQLLGPKRAQEGLQGRFLMDLERFWVEFWGIWDGFWQYFEWFSIA